MCELSLRAVLCLHTPRPHQKGLTSPAVIAQALRYCSTCAITITAKQVGATSIYIYDQCSNQLSPVVAGRERSGSSPVKLPIKTMNIIQLIIESL